MRKPLFERFWNSGAPLIGEDGCSGWQEWAITQQNTRLQPPLPLEPGAPPPCLPIRHTPVYAPLVARKDLFELGTMQQRRRRLGAGPVGWT